MKLVFIILLLVLVIIPASADVWYSEHFTSDNSGDWAGDTTRYTWDTALTTGWLNTTTGNWYQYAYKNEKFGGGTYIWLLQVSKPPSDMYWGGEFGSQNSADTGSLLAVGNKYVWRSYTDAGNGVGFYEFKVVAGAFTQLDSYLHINTNHNWNVTFVWDPATGDHKGYLNNVLRLEVTDGTFTDPGYLGVGHYAPASGIESYDYIEYSNSTSAPTPTPTPTPSPYPVIPTEQPGSGLYIGGAEQAIGIISGIYLTLDQQPFLLMVALILLAVLVLRRR